MIRDAETMFRLTVAVDSWVSRDAETVFRLLVLSQRIAPYVAVTDGRRRWRGWSPPPTLSGEPHHRPTCLPSVTATPGAPGTGAAPTVPDSDIWRPGHRDPDQS